MTQATTPTLDERLKQAEATLRIRNKPRQAEAVAEARERLAAMTTVLRDAAGDRFGCPVPVPLRNNAQQLLAHWNLTTVSS